MYTVFYSVIYPSICVWGDRVVHAILSFIVMYNKNEFFLQIESGVGVYAEAARRRVHLATVLLRPPPGHRPGRRQASFSTVAKKQKGLDRTVPSSQKSGRTPCPPPRIAAQTAWMERAGVDVYVASLRRLTRTIPGGNAALRKRKCNLTGCDVMVLMSSVREAGPRSVQPTRSCDHIVLGGGSRS